MWETKTDVPYMFCTKFHSPRPIFYSPSLKGACIGEQANVNFPHCGTGANVVSLPKTLKNMDKISNVKSEIIFACFSSWYEWITLSIVWAVFFPSIWRMQESQSLLDYTGNPTGPDRYDNPQIPVHWGLPVRFGGECAIQCVKLP